MMKRGQVTIFIALAIVILIVIALVSYYFGDFTVSTKEISLPHNVLKFKESRDRCVENSGTLSLLLLGLQGGYYEIPEDSLNLGDVRVVYLADAGENRLLSMNEIEQNYYRLFNEKLADCLIVPDNLNVVVNKPSVRIDFGDATNVKVKYSMKVNYGGREFDLSDDFEYAYNVRFKYIHESVEDLVLKEIENPFVRDLSFIASSDMDIQIFDAKGLSVYAKNL